MFFDPAKEFPLDDSICYLNHAAVSPWPRRAAEAVSNFAHVNSVRGAADYPTWMTTEKQLRSNLAELIGAHSASDISLVKNTSEALSLIAYGLDWNDGDEVLICEEEFPSNRIVWESLADKNVITRLVKGEAAPEEALINGTTSATRLISVSSIQYATGVRANLKKLGEHCKKHDIWFVVDGIQSIGAEPMNVNDIQADFVAADGHKWMLGPEGLGLFYTTPSSRAALRLNQYGWHMVKHRGDYSRKTWEAAEDGTRFECGSPNMLAGFALEASTALLLEVGLEKVKQEIQERSIYLREHLENEIAELAILSPAKLDRAGGILSFSVGRLPSQKLYEQLMQSGVICACRGGGVRFSPHFYTPYETLDRAISITKKLVLDIQAPT